MSADIIDEIDALVDEQLRQEPSGYDHNINQAQCWHCGRDFHGLAITERMERMRVMYRMTGALDEELVEYRYDEDESPVLCPGSRFIGPRAPFDMSGWESLGYIDNTEGPTFSPDYAEGGPASDLRFGWSLSGPARWTIEVGDQPEPEPESRFDDNGRIRPPRPSTTPPMWANDVTRSRRRR